MTWVSWVTWIVRFLPTALIALMFHLIGKSNLNKRDRWKQIRFVWFSLAYAALCCIILAPIRGLNTVSLPAALCINAGILFGFFIVKRAAKKSTEKSGSPGDWKELEAEDGLRKWYWSALNWVYALEERTFFLRDHWVKVKFTLRRLIRILGVVYALCGPPDRNPPVP